MFVSKVIDNLVTARQADQIENRIVRFDWWTFNDVTSNVGCNYDVHDKNIIETPQFTSTFASQEEGITSPLYMEIVQPLLWMLEKDTGLELEHIVRVKANLLTQTAHEAHNYHIPHVDHGSDRCLSMVYYVNDSDGDTRLFDKFVSDGSDNMKIVVSNTPKKGTGLLFQSHRFHSSSCPVLSDKRVVVNIVFMPTDKSYENFLKKQNND